MTLAPEHEPAPPRRVGYPEVGRLAPQRTSARATIRAGSRQEALPLQWHPTPAAPLRAVADPRLRVVTRPREVPPAEELPEAGKWAAQLVQSVVEVLAGERPVHQLVRWLSPQVYSELSKRINARPPGSSNSAHGHAQIVRSVHLSTPAPRVVEATAVIVMGKRSRAVALRLEGAKDRWRCTRLGIL